MILIAQLYAHHAFVTAHFAFCSEPISMSLGYRVLVGRRWAISLAQTAKIFRSSAHGFRPVAGYCQEPVLLYECSERYNPTVMLQAIGDLYCHWSVKVKSPDFGLVANRSRLYGICLLRDEVLARWGSLDNVIPLFYRQRCELASPATINSRVNFVWPKPCSTYL